MTDDYRDRARARISEIRGGTAQPGPPEITHDPAAGPFSDQVLAAGRQAYERMGRLSDAYSGGTFLVDEMVTAVLAACLPLLDRADVATAATIDPSGALEIGPADTLVLRFPADVTPQQINAWRDMLRVHTPHLDGRVLFVVCDDLAVVRGSDSADEARTDQEGTPE